MEEQDNKTLIIPFSEYKKMEDEIKMFREKEHALSINVRIFELEQQIERLKSESDYFRLGRDGFIRKCSGLSIENLKIGKKIEELKPYKQKYWDLAKSHVELINKYENKKPNIFTTLKYFLKNPLSYLPFTNKYYNRKRIKAKINFFRSLTYEVIVKDWEHNGYFDKVEVKDKRLCGFLKGLRDDENFSCDLKSGDIYIKRVSIEERDLSNEHKYDVGCFVNVKTGVGGLEDTFTSDYVRICFTDDISDIRKLVENAINEEQKKLF